MPQLNETTTEPVPALSAPRWVGIVAAVVAGAVVLWQRTALMPEFSPASLARVGVVVVLVYGTSYALLSLASRARHH